MRWEALAGEAAGSPPATYAPRDPRLPASTFLDSPAPPPPPLPPPSLPPPRTTGSGNGGATRLTPLLLEAATGRGVAYGGGRTPGGASTAASPTAQTRGGSGGQGTHVFHLSEGAMREVLAAWRAGGMGGLSPRV